MYGWELRHEPHRHYKRQKDDGNWTWEGRDRQRIASVTDVLDAKDSLTPWAVNHTLIAAETAAVRFLGAGPALARSVLDFATLTQLTGLMPDTIRDDKGVIGTAVHEYLRELLSPMFFSAVAPPELPFGYKAAVDLFIEQTAFAPIYDVHGARVERAVGDYGLAVAGTYDAQGEPWQMGPLDQGVHRIDAKSSNSVQPKHFAQLAAYEHLARLVGEHPSEFLTIIHLSPLGMWTPYSISAQSAEYDRALAMFLAYLTIHRQTPKLAKLLKRED